MAELTDAMQGRVSQQPEITVAMTYGAQTLLGIDAIAQFEALDNPYPGVVVRPFVEEDCLWDLFIVHPTKHVPTKLEIAFADHLTSCVEFGKTAFEVS